MYTTVHNVIKVLSTSTKLFHFYFRELYRAAEKLYFYLNFNFGCPVQFTKHQFYLQYIQDVIGQLFTSYDYITHLKEKSTIYCTTMRSFHILAGSRVRAPLGLTLRTQTTKSCHNLSRLNSTLRQFSLNHNEPCSLCITDESKSCFYLYKILSILTVTCRQTGNDNLTPKWTHCPHCVPRCCIDRSTTLPSQQEQPDGH